MTNYNQFEFRNQPWFDQNNFQGFNQAIPMKSLVIYCFDPRAAEIPQKVAEHYEGEVYPGENIINEGAKIGHTRTLFEVSNAGGRALSALQSVATMEYLFHFENIYVVHHSFCGATAFTPDQLVNEFHDHHHADLTELFDHDSLAIMDYEKSIKHDIDLLRNSPAVPKNINLYGLFYEMNSGELTEVIRDIPAVEHA
ncbi:carbonic anhydrase [Mucilaginibacter sp. CAU 1740]|uniref:carbonic anhydrase n=1 Tax=Mucilaginibacter sp. CAU 1740 TaxID=3140365 RepID=UPI00325A52DB